MFEDITSDPCEGRFYTILLCFTLNKQLIQKKCLQNMIIETFDLKFVLQNIQMSLVMELNSNYYYE